MAKQTEAFSNADLRAALPEAQNSPIRFALEFPELLAAFGPIDKAAGRARRQSLTVGFLAIGLVLAALILASADPALALLGRPMHKMSGYVAAGLGVLGAIIAVWSRGKSAPRARWLQSRLQTELLRLFHFRHLADRFPQALTAAGDRSFEAAYLAGRTRALARLKQRMANHLEEVYASVLSNSDHDPLEDLEDLSSVEGVAMSPIAERALAGWRETRLEWQLGYCETKLRAAAPGGRPTPMMQEQIFSAVSWACIAVIIVLHVLHFGEEVLGLPVVWMQVGVIWTALIALATRALESGIAPQREVERYEQYRVNIRVAMRRFDAARSFAAKVETMRAFERVSLEEMHVFMRTHAKSHFLL